MERDILGIVGIAVTVVVSSVVATWRLRSYVEKGFAEAKEERERGFAKAERERQEIRSEAKEEREKGFAKAEEERERGFAKAEEERERGFAKAEEEREKGFAKAEEEREKGFAKAEREREKGFGEAKEERREIKSEMNRRFDAVEKRIARLEAPYFPKSSKDVPSGGAAGSEQGSAKPRVYAEPDGFTTDVEQPEAEQGSAKPPIAAKGA